MDVLGDASVFGLIAAVITSIIEVLKAWIPAKYKDENSIVIYRDGGNKHIHIPNQAIWPLLSLILGIGIFYALQYDPLAAALGVGANTDGGMAVSGAATGLFAQGVYRTKNLFGTKMGGDPSTDAQSIGPATTVAGMTANPVDPATTDEANH
jgi:hypothetical protein